MSNFSYNHAFLRLERQGYQDSRIVPSARYTCTFTRLSKSAGSREARTDFFLSSHESLRSWGLGVPNLDRLLPLSASVTPVVIPPNTDQVQTRTSYQPYGQVIDVYAEDVSKERTKLTQAAALLYRWLLPVFIIAALLPIMINGSKTFDHRSQQQGLASQYTPNLGYVTERPTQPTIEGKTILKKAQAGVVSVEEFLVGRGQDSHSAVSSRNRRGTGVVWDNKGHIVASYQSVKDAQQVKVSFNTGEKRRARVIGLDEFNDLAVLKIEGTNFKSITPVEFDKRGTMTGSRAVVNVENNQGRVMSVTSGVMMEECDSCEARWKPYRMSFSSPGKLKGVLMDSEMKLIGFHDGVGSGGIIGTEAIDNFVNRHVT